MLGINDFVVISLYMPVDDGFVESLNACIDALSSITNVLELWQGKYVSLLVILTLIKWKI